MRAMDRHLSASDVVSMAQLPIAPVGGWVLSTRASHPGSKPIERGSLTANPAQATVAAVVHQRTGGAKDRQEF